MEWPRGEATACKAVYTGSNPVSTSVSHEGNTYGNWHRGSASPQIAGQILALVQLNTWIDVITTQAISSIRPGRVAQMVSAPR